MAYQPRAGMPAVPKPEAGWHYRWLADDRDRLAQHQLHYGDAPGYEVIGAGMPLGKVKELASKLGFPDSMVDPMTCRITYGRSVLGRIPHSVAVARRKELAADQIDTLRAADEQMIERAARGGIRATVQEADEFNDRKKRAESGYGGRVSLAGLEVPTSGGA